MNIKVTHQKIQNENPWITVKCAYKFKIVSSILKKHYKALANMSMLFNAEERNVGFVRKENEQAFLKLIEDIENSNDKRCETSHKKSLEKYKNQKSKIRCEHEDLGSLGYRHGDRVKCPDCGEMCEVW